MTTTVTPRDLATKAARFRDEQHPRDREGKFIEIGAHVRLWGGRSGTVTRNLGGGRIEVAPDGGGKPLNVHRNYLTVTAGPKGEKPADQNLNARRRALRVEQPSPDAVIDKPGRGDLNPADEARDDQRLTRDPALMPVGEILFQMDGLRADKKQTPEHRARIAALQAELDSREQAAAGRDNSLSVDPKPDTAAPTVAPAVAASETPPAPRREPAAAATPTPDVAAAPRPTPNPAAPATAASRRDNAARREYVGALRAAYADPNPDTQPAGAYTAQRALGINSTDPERAAQMRTGRGAHLAKIVAAPSTTTSKSGGLLIYSPRRGQWEVQPTSSMMGVNGMWTFSDKAEAIEFADRMEAKGKMPDRTPINFGDPGWGYLRLFNDRGTFREFPGGAGGWVARQRADYDRSKGRDASYYEGRRVSTSFGMDTAPNAIRIDERNVENARQSGSLRPQDEIGAGLDGGRSGLTAPDLSNEDATREAINRIDGGLSNHYVGHLIALERVRSQPNLYTADEFYRVDEEWQERVDKLRADGTLVSGSPEDALINAVTERHAQDQRDNQNFTVPTVDGTDPTNVLRAFSVVDPALGDAYARRQDAYDSVRRSVTPESVERFEGIDEEYRGLSRRAYREGRIAPGDPVDALHGRVESIHRTERSQVHDDAVSVLRDGLTDTDTATLVDAFRNGNRMDEFTTDAYREVLDQRGYSTDGSINANGPGDMSNPVDINVDSPARDALIGQRVWWNTGRGGRRDGILGVDADGDPYISTPGSNQRDYSPGRTVDRYDVTADDAFITTRPPAEMTVGEIDTVNAELARRMATAWDGGARVGDPDFDAMAVRSRALLDNRQSPGRTAERDLIDQPPAGGPGDGQGDLFDPKVKAGIPDYSGAPTAGEMTDAELAAEMVKVNDARLAASREFRASGSDRDRAILRAHEGRFNGLLNERIRRENEAARARPVDVNDTRAKNVREGDRVLTTNAYTGESGVWPVDSVAKGEDDGVILTYRDDEGRVWDEEIPGTDFVPVVARGQSDPAGADDGAGEDVGGGTTADVEVVAPAVPEGYVRMGDAVRGQYIDPGDGRVRKIVKVTDNPDGTRAVTLEDAAGRRQTVPFGSDAQVRVARDWADPNLTGPEHRANITAHSAQTKTSRPTLYTYQRKTLIGLGLDDDRSQSDEVRQAAARIRARQPLSDTQSRVLADAVAKIAADPNISAVKKRALNRIADRLDAAGARVDHRPAPAPRNRDVTPATPETLGAGDEIAYRANDLTVIVGQVVGVKSMMRGRLYQITVKDNATGETKTITRHAGTNMYVLPDIAPPPPVSLLPNRRSEFVTSNRIDVGDTVYVPHPDTRVLTAAKVTYASENSFGYTTLDGVEAYHARNDYDQVLRSDRGSSTLDQPVGLTTAGQNVSPPINVRGLPFVKPGMFVHITHGGASYSGWVTAAPTVDNGVGFVDIYIPGRGTTTQPVDYALGHSIVHVGEFDTTTGAQVAAAAERENYDRLRAVHTRDLISAAAPEYRYVFAPMRADLTVADIRTALRNRMVLATGDTSEWRSRTRSTLTRSAYGTEGSQSDRELRRVGFDSLASEIIAEHTALMNGHIDNFDTLPGESAEAALDRLRTQLDENPPLSRKMGDLATTLTDLKLLTGPDATGPTPAGRPAVPTFADDAPLTDRLNGYRQALGESGFGRTQSNVNVWKVTSFDDLVAGKKPELVNVGSTLTEAKAADGGPGETTMAHLNVVRAAGADIDTQVQKRVIGGLRDTGLMKDGESPSETSTRLDNERTVAYEAWRTSNEGSDAQDAAEAGALAVFRREGFESRGAFSTALSAAFIYNTDPPEVVARKTAENSRLRALRTEASEAGYAARDAYSAGAFTALQKARADATAFKAARKAGQRQAVIDVLTDAGVDFGGTTPINYFTTDKYGRRKSQLTDRSELVKKMRVAESNFPTVWLNLLAQRVPQGWGLKKVGRGYYNDRDRLIALSDGDTVATHELGHGMEQAIPGLLAAQNALLWSRTSTGDVGTRQREPIYRIGNSRTERGWRDQFPQSYTGKDYGDSAYEVFTTQIESLMAGSDYADDDLRQWTLGVLATLGHPVTAPEAPAVPANRKVFGDPGSVRRSLKTMPKEQADNIRAVFAYKHGPSGFSVEINDEQSSHTPTLVYVTGSIKDKDGKVVGSVTRTVRDHGGGRVEVHHDYLSLNPDQQGNGFNNGEDFSPSQIANMLSDIRWDKPTSGGKKITLWPGKSALLGRNWYGKFEITPTGTGR